VRRGQRRPAASATAVVPVRAACGRARQSTVMTIGGMDDSPLGSVGLFIIGRGQRMTATCDNRAFAHRPICGNICQPELYDFIISPETLSDFSVKTNH
jgi:hypothetical protein